MTRYSTNEAARKLGISSASLSNYIKAEKIPAPKSVEVGKVKLHSWSTADIERVRKLLPKIANGRKTRWQRQREAEKKKQAKAKKTPARAPVPHKKRKTKG